MVKTIDNKDYYFCFETNKLDKENHHSYYFFKPIKILQLTEKKDLNDFFTELSTLSKKYYLAGFFSYELGYLFEDVFQSYSSLSFPYALFGVYEKPVLIDHNQKKRYQPKIFSQLNEKSYSISDLHLNLSKNEYQKKISQIKKYIYEGDIFQVNYTGKYKFKFTGSAEKFYHDLKRKQNVAYNVFAKIGDITILSLSPELFFKKRKNQIIVKPMKGTISRGKNLIEDEAKKTFLIHDPKNTSENVMIVDLLRNDLGKISQYGSVKVKKLFECEKYNTLFQMTSTIESTLKEKTTIKELIKSTFPSGSVTGAPKIRSMEIIKDLEKEPRYVYTGAIGFFQPNGEAQFNVPIRTILIKNNQAEMGVGSGIVYDSDKDEEFAECQLKAHFLTNKPIKEFKLITTLLYNQEFKYLTYHIKRLNESSEYFNYCFNQEKLLTQLSRLKKTLTKDKYKIRILIKKDGHFEIQKEKIETLNKNINLCISSKRTDKKNIFYYHKTTNRILYQEEFEKARKQGCFDTIFLNQENEITEGAISNIYIEKNKKLYTPPIHCGVLNGVMRQVLFDSKNNIKEKIITLKDLSEADQIYISNAVIGFQKVKLIETKN